MKYQAHRGVSTEAPENTLASVYLAIAQGYQVIELDVDVTLDGKFVLLHDHSLARTARTPDGKPLEKAPDVSDITYEEMLSYDFGLWFSLKYKGERAPLLSEALNIAREHGVKVKIDNKYRFFNSQRLSELYALLGKYTDVAQLTCYTLDDLKEAVLAIPEADFHYDGEVSEDILKEISALLPGERVTVWSPIENSLTWWVKVAYADEALSTMIRRYAKLGLWILSSYGDAEKAERLGADIVETNGLIKPCAKKGVVADMHTHSEHSHDSVCPIADMRAAQIEKGTSIMAVTDHFDTHSFGYYDIHTPIARGHRDADHLNSDGSTFRVLRGIELGEAFWSQPAYERIRSLDYDVILGSVHIMRYSEGYCIYSHSDFSAIPTEKIYELMDAYFDDILTMMRRVDFDVLSHLTCPLRYIEGKYKIPVDLSRFDAKIDKILDELIRQGKALEVNTSSYRALGELMPPIGILKRYYDKGGYLLTIGSDAHVAANASVDFDAAIECLRQIGFKHLYYYENRKAIPYEI